MSLEKCRFIALGLLLVATSAKSQPHVHQASPPQPSVVPSRPAEVGRDPPYKSVFKDYRRFDGDLAVRDWSEVNRTVFQRGGWRAYAKDAAAAEPPKQVKP